MKHIYYIILVIVILIIEFGILLPYLISSKNDELVYAGLLLMIFGTPFLLNLLYKKIKNAVKKLNNKEKT